MLKLNNKDNPTKSRQKTGHLTRDTQMVEKHMKSHSRWTFIRDVKITSITRYYLREVKKAIIKIPTHKKSYSELKKKGTLFWCWWML